MLKKVILCPNPYRDHELIVAKEAKRILDSVHCPNVVCVPFRNEEKPEGYGLDIRPLQQELRGADMIIAFGGDGTILHLSKTAAHRDIPVLGVNLGSLGFMAELEQKELGRLGELMDEKYSVESRMMLDVSVVREGRVIYSNLALNEAVVTRGAVSRVIRLHIRTEQGRLLDVTGDGVIVASPTGSLMRWSCLMSREMVACVLSMPCSCSFAKSCSCVSIGSASMMARIFSCRLFFMSQHSHQHLFLQNIAKALIGKPYELCFIF